MGAIQPIHLCLGGVLCSPVLLVVVGVAIYALRRRDTPPPPPPLHLPN